MIKWIISEFSDGSKYGGLTVSTYYRALNLEVEIYEVAWCYSELFDSKFKRFIIVKFDDLGRGCATIKVV